MLFAYPTVSTFKQQNINLKKKLTCKYCSTLLIVTVMSLPPFLSSIFGNPGRVKLRAKSSTLHPSIDNLSKRSYKKKLD